MVAGDCDVKRLMRQPHVGQASMQVPVRQHPPLIFREILATKGLRKPNLTRARYICFKTAAMAAVARMAAPASRPQKRKAALGIDAAEPPPLPISKRTRYGVDDNTKEGKEGEGSTHDKEARGVIDDDYSSPASPVPSIPFTEEASVVETSATTASKRPNKYICQVEGCGKAFNRPIRLVNHTRSHTNERPFVCNEDDCGKTFTRAEHLTRHKKDKHVEARDHVCSHVLDTAEGGVCGRSFTTATRLRRHVAAHEAKEETTCPLPGCGRVFRKQDTLQRHIKTAHLHEKPFRCEHVDVDEEGVAVECSQAFAKSDGLKNHIAREHSGMRYFCEICTEQPGHVAYGSALDDEHRLDMSMDPLTLEDSMVYPEPTLEEIQPDTETHSSTPPTNRVGFATYSDLQLHLRTLHPPTCTFPGCGKICESNRALKAHQEIEHSALTTRQTHLCTWPDCDRGFTKAGNLKVHYRSVHMKARGFICGEFDLSDRMGAEGIADGAAILKGWNGVGCGRGFGTKANLEEHIRTQHLGMKGKIKPCRMRKAEAIKLERAEYADELEEYERAEVQVDDGALWKLTGYIYDGQRIDEALSEDGELIEMGDGDEEDFRRELIIETGAEGEEWRETPIDPALQAV
ncbi:hypothetical protein LTR35_007464 [Friedmanniomyces endolithicus]|uniref:C2H2-type domain-containing protein n=2 Tax=Friedmanniomyces endolithicus TaxID=329885 RepID=A0AAN6J1Y1_9PEZI|nr:hypothetical protein LTR35_007464 [Friedmanniomyces endolithicus]KAK0297223.1 hypothetical protein LTS00_003944 [Friedmanniomyces endolithicus]KAK0309538.1 hypothetical protein LTR82_015160 [Friedmanniomyces endolithicus]KAK0835995.1 hypothetical protein LTR73_000496 [Friedmanniomyces endolithicus]KAK1008421.1 hypothetical protein LTR54_006214 [Friedmanniomyces endolithicus]